MLRKRPKKGLARKDIVADVWSGDGWKVRAGSLVAGPGRPQNVEPLFKAVAEKLPFASIGAVRAHVVGDGIETMGVYVAHDSMGYARYVGRGNVFQRLKARHKTTARELKYFSFYIVVNKRHEREVETLVIRAGGPHLHFNSHRR